MRDDFTNGYIEALIWADCGPDSECAGKDEDDFAPEMLATILADCRDFQKWACKPLKTACQSPRYSMSRAGHDFWLTRNGHGAGFWDRSELHERTQQALCDWSKRYGEVSPYLGDDGRVYLG